MDKRSIFSVLLTALIAIVVLLAVVNLVFRTNKINEGKFRITDVIITSTAELTDKTVENGVWSLNVSQKNLLSMLVRASGDASIDRIYLSNIKAVGDKPIVLYLANNENKIELTRKSQELEIEYTMDENNQIKLEIVALNENILKNWAVPESIKEVICDGRIFEKAGYSLKDLQFILSFNLNIIEKTGKSNVLKVKLVLPNEELLKSGADVRRLNLTNFKFKVK